jgi:hypothetical protein
MVTCVEVARLCEKGYVEKEGLDTRWVEILRHILVCGWWFVGMGKHGWSHGLTIHTFHLVTKHNF